MSSAHRVQAPMWLLVLITLCGTLAIHMFVPAMPAAGRELGADAADMRMTISLYIFSLACGQLAYGPLADRFGRRPVLLAGLSLFGASSIAAGASPSAEILIWARVGQALGSGAGIALGRAMVRDISDARDSARRLATLNMMIMIGPGAAPLAGALVAGAIGWRGIFVLLAGAAFIALTLCWRILPETHASPGQMNAAAVARGYFALLRSPKFLGLAICGGCVTTSFYTFFASSAFIAEEMGRPVYEAGLYLTIIIACVSSGSVMARRLVAKQPLVRVLRGGSLLCLVSALAFLSVVAAGQLGVAAMLLTLCAFGFGAGISSPVALSLSVSVDEKVIGSASGLYGFVQMGVGAICAHLGGIGASPAMSAALVLVAAALVAQACLMIATRASHAA